MKKMEELKNVMENNEVIAIVDFRTVDNCMHDLGYYSRYDEITKEEIESGTVYYTSRFTNEIGAKVEFINADITDFANDSLLYNATIRMKDEPEIVKNGEEINVEEYLQEVISAYMKDDVREAIHNEYAPCTFNKFLKEYCDRDIEFEDLLNSEFSISIF